MQWKQTCILFYAFPGYSVKNLTKFEIWLQSEADWENNILYNWYGMISAFYRSFMNMWHDYRQIGICAVVRFVHWGHLRTELTCVAELVRCRLTLDCYDSLFWFYRLFPDSLKGKPPHTVTWKKKHHGCNITQLNARTVCSLSFGYDRSMSLCPGCLINKSRGGEKGPEK